MYFILPYYTIYNIYSHIFRTSSGTFYQTNDFQSKLPLMNYNFLIFVLFNHILSFIKVYYYSINYYN